MELQSIELKRLLRMVYLLVLYFILLWLASCGPVVYTTTRPGPPPPSWFYPNRVEIVRYVYFPELHFYYDFYSSSYLILESGIWVRYQTLPSKYRSYNLNRYRYKHIPGYRNDDIGPYDRNRRSNRGRSNQDLYQ